MLTKLEKVERLNAFVNSAFLLPIEEAPEYLPDESVAFISHPLLAGADAAININSERITIIQNGLADQVTHNLKEAAVRHEARLLDLFAKLELATGCDCIEIDCRLIASGSQLGQTFDLWRVRAYRDGALTRQYPYEFEIFDEENDPIRLLTWIGSRNFEQPIEFIKAATQMIVSEAYKQEKLDLEGVLWIPLSQTETLPCFMVRPDKKGAAASDGDAFWRTVMDGPVTRAEVSIVRIDEVAG